MYGDRPYEAQVMEEEVVELFGEEYPKPVTETDSHIYDTLQ